MYTLFVQKKKSDNSPFPLTKQLHDFLCHTNANGMFVAPGHLSKDPTKVQRLLGDMLAGTNIAKLGIGNKYGGDYLDIYENYLDSQHKLWRVNRNGRSDHSKMVFIFRYTDDILADISSNNYKVVLAGIEMLGVAIGSSNFSYTSYGPISSAAEYADKGESDILMFFDEAFKNKLQDQCYNALESNMVLSQSLAKVPVEFLKQMFIETLKYTLE